LFSGGSDLDPGLYDQEPHDETFGIHEARDRAELALLEAALERDMPVLAICRGSQVLNVARGGDLVQHLPDVVGDEKHKHTPGTYADHDVTLEEGTRLGSLLGDRAPVKSHHHQGIGRIGTGLRVAAHAEDGTVEAVEESGPALRPRRPLASGSRRGRASLRGTGARSGAVSRRPERLGRGGLTGRGNYSHGQVSDTVTKV